MVNISDKIPHIVSVPHRESFDKLNSNRLIIPSFAGNVHYKIKS